MKFSDNNGLESCSDCFYATKYFPYYTFPFFDPYCEKGHGRCEVNKSCEDYKSIISICGKCKFIELEDKRVGYVCVKHNVSVEFNNRICDEFEQRLDRIRE